MGLSSAELPISPEGESGNRGAAIAARNGEVSSKRTFSRAMSANSSCSTGISRVTRTALPPPRQAGQKVTPEYPQLSHPSPSSDQRMQAHSVRPVPSHMEHGSLESSRKSFSSSSKAELFEPTGGDEAAENDSRGEALIDVPLRVTDAHARVRLHVASAVTGGASLTREVHASGAQTRGFTRGGRTRAVRGSAGRSRGSGERRTADRRRASGGREGHGACRVSLREESDEFTRVRSALPCVRARARSRSHSYSAPLQKS